MQKWGNIIIPWSVAWTGENEFFIAYCPYAKRRALCQKNAPGVGKPDFGKPHSDRQRRAMALHLCDICAHSLKSRTKVSLSQESPRQVDRIGFIPLAVEPLVHRECALISLQQCPELKRQAAAGTLRIRQVLGFKIISQILNEAATLEFAKVSAAGVTGHLKLAITNAIDREVSWLER